MMGFRVGLLRDIVVGILGNIIASFGDAITLLLVLRALHPSRR